MRLYLRTFSMRLRGNEISPRHPRFSLVHQRRRPVGCRVAGRKGVKSALGSLCGELDLDFGSGCPGHLLGKKIRVGESFADPDVAIPFYPHYLAGFTLAGFSVGKMVAMV